MNLYILNTNEEVVEILSGKADNSACHFFNAKMTKEINKGTTLTFEVDLNELGDSENIKEENMVVVPDGDVFKLFIIREVVDIHDTDFIKEVYCEDASIELADEVCLENISGKQEIITALNTLLKGTRWEAGEVDNVYIRSLKGDYRGSSVLAGINTLIGEYDVEVDYSVSFVGNKITGRFVHIKQAFGRTLGKRFEYKKDLVSLKRTVNTGDIKTAIIPFGKVDEETGEAVTIENVSWSKPTNSLNKPLGQTYLEDEEATQLWGYKGSNGKRRARWIVVNFEDCESAEELISLAHLQLKRFTSPTVTYEAEAQDLYLLTGDEDYSFETVELGDLVNIVDHDFVPALTLSSRIVKIEKNLNFPAESKITMGTIIKSIVDKDLQTQLNELNYKVSSVASNVDLSGVEERLDDLETTVSSGRWEAISEINNLLFGEAVGYHYIEEGNGIWVYDRPKDQNPTKAVAIKGGTIGLASYDEQLQEWKVGTFIDGNSVNASMINTGTLKADRIEANALTVNHFNQELKTIINSVGDKPSRTEVTTSIKTAVDEINLSVSTKYSTKSETESMKTTAITESKSYADTKKQEAITTASTDATNKVNSAKTELNKTIDNIQVGGRNLLRNSALEGITFPYTSAEYNWRTASVNPSDTVLRTRELIKDCPAFPQGVYGIKFVYSGTTDLNVDIAQDGRVMEHGETYTLSAYFKLTKGNPKFALQYGTTPYPAKSFNGSNEWVKCSFTFTYDKTQFSDKLSTNIYFGIRGNSFEGYACGFKLEKGNKSTDWTPAPEDVNSEINKKANSVDVYTKTETYTKAQTDSAIKVAKDSITNTVSQTYLSKGDASNTYATKSSLTQTKDSITASFKSSGGYNLIRNSTGYNGVNLWTKTGGTMGTASNDNIGGASSIYMYLDNGTNTSEVFAISKRFKLKANTKYTLSGWFHNYTKCPNFDVYVLSSTAVGETDSGTTYTNTQKLIDYGNTNGGWKKFSVTFTTPANVKSGIVRIDANGYNASGTNSNRVHWSALMLNEGEEQPWSPHPSEVYDGSTVIDASGVTVKNGALKVQNKAGQTVLSGDSTGNLNLTGTLINKSSSGVDAIKIEGTNMYFYDWERNARQLGLIYSSQLTNYPNCRGFSIGHHNQGYMNLTYRKTDGNYLPYMTFDKYNINPNYAAPIRFLESAVFSQAVNMQNRVYVPNVIYLGSNAGTTVPMIFGTNNRLVMQVSVSNKDDGLKIQTNTGGILAQILAGYSYPILLNNNTQVSGNFSVTGSKNSLQKTQNYGDRLINAFETAEYYYSDFGFGKIDESGLCYISIDEILQECTNSDCKYHVFTQIYDGNITKIDKQKGYFIVHGAVGTEFSWQFIGKRIGYEAVRLDEPEIGTIEDFPSFSDDELFAKTNEDILLDELTFDLEKILMED